MPHAAGAVLGVCNGFQILLEAGMLPGVLVRNRDLRFVCRETCLQVEHNSSSVFTSHLPEGAKLHIPVAHNEGNYFAEAETLAELEANGQVALRYKEEASKARPTRTGQSMTLPVSSQLTGG